MSDWQKDMEKDLKKDKEWTKVESKSKTKSTYVPRDKIREAQDRKFESISNSQDVKNNSIRMAGAARDATLIVTTFYPEIADPDFEGRIQTREETIKEQWLMWRKWFYQQSDLPFL